MGAILDSLTGIPNFTGRVFSALAEGKLIHYASKNIAKRIWLRRMRRSSKAAAHRDRLSEIAKSFTERQRAYTALLERRALAGKPLFESSDADFQLNVPGAKQ